MKILLRLFLLLAVTLVFTTGAVRAEQDQQLKADEFPNGKHFRVNIIARKDVSCKQNDSNMLFVPLNGNNVKVLMQIVPGKSEGEPAPFQVTDPCTASIDGDPAVIQLPKDAPGYMIYGRMPEKSAVNTFMHMMPQLIIVQDEFGSNLVYLGKLTSSGFESPYGVASKKKGQWSQQDISGLFEWSGSICYPKPALCIGCIKASLCCSLETAPGTYEGCSAKNDMCPPGTSDAVAFCNSYIDEWILNIAAFSNYLWTTTEKNSQKNLEVVFYPVH